MKTLVLGAAAFMMAAGTHLVDPGLTVHEWGTFTSVAGADGSAVQWNTLGCKDDLPSFVNEYGYRGFKVSLRGTVRMETPVMFFYSPRSVDASVRVAFPDGLITEWYPRAEYSVYRADRFDGSIHRLPPNQSGIDISMRNQTGVIAWKTVKVEPNTAPSLPVESAQSRYYAARATDASPLEVDGRHEKFLFYRGVANIAVPLSARVRDTGNIVVENRSAGAIPAAILFENRGGRIGYRSASAIESTAAFDRPSLDASPAQLRSDLESALVAQGLYRKEAAAMIETWRDSWFEEGSRLIYILPSEAVNRMLPLEIEPAPSEIVRVFVARIELITPETKRAVKEAVAKNDGNTLAQYQRFLDPILRSTGETTNRFGCR